jgi:hypothetical protein
MAARELPKQQNPQAPPPPMPAGPDHPSPPPQPAAQHEGKPPRRLALRIVLAVIIVAGGVAGGVLIPSYLKQRHVINKAQWRAVPFGATRQQAIDRLGKDPSRQASGTLFYNGSGHHVVAQFGFERGKLWVKEWRVGLLSKTTISSAQRRSVRKRATERQLIRRFGPPAERADKAGNAKFAPSLRRLGFVSGVVRSRCISYLLRSDPSKTIEFCFNARTGRLR